ncbi:MAG: hypothetical protein ACHQ4G_02645 [Opitutales bacterium]
MKATLSTFPTLRGSALIVVIIMVALVSILTASILTYSISERTANERQRMLLAARNMAENVAVYASEQVSTKLYRLRSTSPIAFIGGTNQIYLPPTSALTTNYSTSSSVQIYAGLLSSTGLVYVDPTVAANASNPNAGLQVSTSLVPIIAKATMTYPAVGSVTAYAEQDLQISMIPLYQFAVFYNQDLELAPGANMTITGPVHANGNLILRDQTGFSNTVQFTARVTASGGFYANTAHDGATYSNTDTADTGPGGTGPLNFQNPAGTVTNIQSSSGTWRDYYYGNSSSSATTLSQFKTFATSTYGGNLRTSVHGVTPLVLPGMDPSVANSGRNTIALPSTSDSAGLIQSKFSRNAGLYIVVNPDPNTRTGVLPDASTVSMPGYSYRCWLNTVNADGTYTLTEVVLPGQPSYGTSNGTQNNLPNRFTDDTAIGMNQVLRIPASGRSTDNPITTFGSYNSGTGVTTTINNLTNTLLKTGYATGTCTLNTTTTTIPDAYFYDLRRANNSLGHPFNRTSTNPFAPRPISKIDFDMMRFRLMVERTVGATSTSSAIFNPAVPSSTNWSANVLNPSATPVSVSLCPQGTGLSGTGFPVNSSSSVTSDPFSMYYTTGAPVVTSGLITTTAPCPWFDGVTVYIDSVDADAGVTSPVRVDSGVRLWNGRGPLVSLNGTTYPSRTGLALATNDAVYVIGHFNADGTINSTSTSTTNPGGYSAQYPDSTSEMLVSVMSDALTIVSQPTYTKSGSNYYQSSGWCDSLSGSRRDTSGNWVSAWATTNPSNSNSEDGASNSVTPATMPNLGTGSPGSGSAQTSKFAPVQTEVSSCFLTGIVTTTSHQTSGGLHNFPRLLENWSGTGLYIRGSMICLFSSVVATEPWSLGIYTGAGRYWGMNVGLSSPNHHIPLEPIMLNAQRLHYFAITSAAYNTMATTIQALPH